MSILEENKMRQTVIATAAVSVTIIVALYGATVMTADAPQKAQAAAAWGSIDVMQLMKAAKDLPDQRFDPI